jgi:hypothetical protein
MMEVEQKKNKKLFSKLIDYNEQEKAWNQVTKANDEIEKLIKKRRK